MKAERALGESLVRWIPREGSLVDADGFPVTDAQDRIAAQILRLGLLRFTRTLARSPGRVLNEYACAARPGCAQSHELTHEQWRDEVGRVRNAFSCDCQRSRGGPRTMPGVCSHTIALRRFIAEGST
ncbi:MAG: hypothetical protein ACYDCK_01595 [Thermoplasmatota archaeon]